MIIQRYYEPTGTYENYDTVTNEWTNANGQPLRDPEEYDPHGEGYTPFGDE